MSGGSEHLPSREDGLPARVSGAWAQEKLAYLRKCKTIFNGGKNQWEPVYLDLLAGPGRCVVTQTLEEFAGSPLLARASMFCTPPSACDRLSAW
jgi:hypothetical protein